MHHRLAILGHPIGHSLSPVFHTTALQLCGLEGSYEAIDVAPAALTRTWHEELRDRSTGLNITLPHKVEIMRLMDDVAGDARESGAVNTAVRTEGGWVGHNTDVAGVERTLSHLRSSFADGSIVVIGAGGAARAVLHALGRMAPGRDVFVINRNRERAELLCETFRRVFPSLRPLSANGPEGADIARASALLIQATPVGMHPQEGRRPLEGLDVFSTGQVVFDLIYRPRETRFLSDARASGATVVGGLEMFLHQAAASFELWTGVTPPIDKLRPVIEQHLTEGT